MIAMLLSACCNWHCIPTCCDQSGTMLQPAFMHVLCRCHPPREHFNDLNGFSSRLDKERCLCIGQGWGWPGGFRIRGCAVCDRGLCWL